MSQSLIDSDTGSDSDSDTDTDTAVAQVAEPAVRTEIIAAIAVVGAVLVVFVVVVTILCILKIGSGSKNKQHSGPSVAVAMTTPAPREAPSMESARDFDSARDTVAMPQSLSTISVRPRTQQYDSIPRNPSSQYISTSEAFRVSETQIYDVMPD